MSPAAEGRGHPETVHAGCVVLGSAGVLIRGPSGSGKSALAIALIEAWRLRGLYSALVSDDRVHLALPNDRLIASAPETISGLIEQHGRGIRSLPDLPRVVVRLIVDLLPRETIDRMPEPAALMVAVSGVLNACDTMAGATDGGGRKPAADAATGSIMVSRQPVPCRDITIAIPLVQAALHDLDGQSVRFFT